jgi:hypothetical protein
MLLALIRKVADLVHEGVDVVLAGFGPGNLLAINSGWERVDAAANF